MPTPIFKPMTNMPLTGTLTAAYYQPSREVQGKTFGAQVKLRGTWTGTTDKGPQRNAPGDLYLPDFLANDMCRDGILVDGGTGADGSPLFTVGIAAIVIERTEQGQKRKTTITPQGGAPKQPAPGVIPPQAVPYRAAGGAAGVRASQAGPGMPTPKPVNDGDALWAELEARYIRCARMAEQTWALANLPPESVVAAAATLFIEANRRNLPGVPAVTPKVGEGFEEMPEALDEDDSEGMPF